MSIDEAARSPAADAGGAQETDGRKKSDSGLFSALKGLFAAAPEQTIEEALENAPAAIADLPKDRRDMIARVIAFDSQQVENVMTPRADIVAVPVDASLPEILNIFDEAGHSRMPIYGDNLDDPIGMVHIKDIVGLLANPNEAEDIGAAPILSKVRREVIYAPPSMRVTDLLLQMQVSRVHLALVVDEFGGTDGLVTIEDLVEEIVGEINDEHDDDDPTMTQTEDGAWEAAARIEIADFEETVGVSLDLPEGEEEDIDTLGGLVFTLAGRVPKRGEVIAHPEGLEFEILEADPRRIRRLRVRAHGALSADDDA
ncbi:MAG: hemolysin family protein [Pseudomonadota bacterium]